MRVGLLPTEKVIPFLIAREAQLFEREGLAITVGTVGSARERDARLQAGDFDVVLMNLVSVVPLLAEGYGLQGLTVVERSSGQHPMFSMVAAPNAVRESTSVMATSIGTIAEFVASALGRDRWGADLTLADVPDIELRAQMVIEGRVSTAVLPEPAASACLAAGCTLLSDDRSMLVPPPLFVARRDRASPTRAELDAFRLAYEHAVRLAHADPDLAVRTARLAGLAVSSADQLPAFPEWDRPTLEEAARALEWWATWKSSSWAAVTSSEALVRCLMD